MSFQFGNKLSLIWKKLKRGDYTVRPFEVYKLWEVTTDTLNRNYYGNFDINVFRAFYPENHLYFGGIATLSSSLYQRVFTTQSVDPKMLWYHLDHTFYTDHKKEENPTILTEFGRDLYLAESSSVFVTPQDVFGEGIRRGSFTMTNLHSSTAALNYRIYDDSKGNLKDASFDETKFVDSTYLLMYVGFNEKYREFNFRNKPVEYVIDNSNYQNDVKIINSKNISYHKGILTTDTSEPSGVSAGFNGSYLDIRKTSIFNFSNKNDFAFSFWLNIPPTQSNEVYDYNSIFNKNQSIDGNHLCNFLLLNYLACNKYHCVLHRCYCQFGGLLLCSLFQLPTPVRLVSFFLIAVLWLSQQCQHRQQLHHTSSILLCFFFF